MRDLRLQTRVTGRRQVVSRCRGPRPGPRHPAATCRTRVARAPIRELRVCGPDWGGGGDFRARRFCSTACPPLHQLTQRAFPILFFSSFLNHFNTWFSLSNFTYYTHLFLHDLFNRAQRDLGLYFVNSIHRTTLLDNFHNRSSTLLHLFML